MDRFMYAVAKIKLWIGVSGWYVSEGKVKYASITLWKALYFNKKVQVWSQTMMLKNSRLISHNTVYIAKMHLNNVSPK